MSELTPCNYCNLERIKTKAKLEKAEVVVKKKPWGNFKKGVDVFMIDKEGKKEWQAWLAETSPKCVC